MKDKVRNFLYFLTALFAIPSGVFGVVSVYFQQSRASEEIIEAFHILNSGCSAIMALCVIALVLYGSINS